MEIPLFSSARSVGDLLAIGAEALGKTSTSARLDSEVLLGHLLGYTRTQLIIHATDPCKGDTPNRFAALISRRAKGEPVAYITGEREFWGLPFTVTPAVLVPRPESELIVEEALSIVKDLQSVTFADLGTGSGCLSIALTTELLRRGCDVHGAAVDISAEALAVARANAQNLGVGERIRFVQGSWFQTEANFTPPYDVIVANPPYIDPADKVPAELNYEPVQALFADDAGLRDVKVIIEQSCKMLRKGGVLLCEVGSRKRARLPELFSEYVSQFEAHMLGDTSTADRFTVIKLVKK